MKSQAVECSKDTKPEDVILLASLMLSVEIREILSRSFKDTPETAMVAVACKYLSGAKKYILEKNKAELEAAVILNNVFWEINDEQQN
jgi:hypothetical protein